MSVVGISLEVWEEQRRLKCELLDRRAISESAARDVAAHMLLNLHDLSACWFVATNWLRERLQCDRVDTGFGSPQSREYFPSFAEAKSSSYEVPTLGGFAVVNHDEAMQAMWASPRPMIFADLKQDRRLGSALRQRLQTARTKSKFAAALRIGDTSFGLICADWTEHLVPLESDKYDCFELAVKEVLSPVIAVAKRLDDQNVMQWNGQTDGDINAVEAQRATQIVTLGSLTKAEADVSRLVAKGLSYKQIAAIRSTSFSTVDHQLRSIREKTGVSSTTALISLLARIDISKH